MVIRLFLLYLLVEVAAAAALVWAIGFGWTVLVLLAAWVIGLAIAGAHIIRQVARLRAGGLRRESALSDSVFIALGTWLIIVPGLVSTVTGVLLVLPGTRAAVRPVLTTAALGPLGRRMRLVMLASTGVRHYAAYRRGQPTGGQVIDGEVIASTDAVGTEPAMRPVPPVLPVDVARPRPTT